ncbi:MAG: pyridoxal phosphate-dependent aminotransferase [Bdellovibrio sp.]|nr:MAG: pyridoxal phosphate-dependent aminotransferase [Bdellovibrio sp.]
MVLSNRARSLKPSPTLAMANRARELAAQGLDVISLTVGEPDWPTLPSASQAGIRAIQDGQTKYTAAHGIPELRKALRPWIFEETGVEYSESEIVVGSGAKFVIAALLQMVVDPGDEVLIPSPYWVSYPVMAELAGGIPRVIECTEATNFLLTPQDLEAAITPRTKALILCSPSNPTGLAYSHEQLQGLARIVKKYPQLIVISDDIYNRLTFSGNPIAPHILKADPSLKDRVVVVNGASKAFSMTGWRLGWAAGPAGLMKFVADYFSQTTSNPCSISQYAALGALQKGKAELDKSLELLRERCKKGLAALKDVPQLKVANPHGAFYFWVDVKAWIGKTHEPSGRKISGSKDVAELLLDSCHLATVPGNEFGTEGYLRLSFAIQDERFAEAVGRLKKFATSLS